MHIIRNDCDFDSPQREIEELEKAVGEAEVAEAEAGRVARQSHPALVVDVSSHLWIAHVMFDRFVQKLATVTRATHRGYPGGRHLLEEALGARGVEAVDGVPAVLLRTQLHRLHVLVSVLADLRRDS